MKAIDGTDGIAPIEAVEAIEASEAIDWKAIDPIDSSKTIVARAATDAA